MIDLSKAEFFIIIEIVLSFLDSFDYRKLEQLQTLKYRIETSNNELRCVAILYGRSRINYSE